MATDALVKALTGDVDGAVNLLHDATEMLARIRTEIAFHEREEFDYPADIDARALESAIIDMAIASASIGKCEAAHSLLRDLEPIDALEAERLVNDPTLSELRRSVQTKQTC